MARIDTRQLFIFLTVICVIMIFIGSVINIPATPGPIGPAPEILILAHFFAYGVLAGVAYLASNRSKKSTYLVAISVILYGIALEIIQNFVGRNMSAFDALINATGVIVALAFLKSFR